MESSLSFNWNLSALLGFRAVIWRESDCEMWRLLAFLNGDLINPENKPVAFPVPLKNCNTRQIEWGWFLSDGTDTHVRGAYTPMSRTVGCLWDCGTQQWNPIQLPDVLRQRFGFPHSDYNILCQDPVIQFPVGEQVACGSSKCEGISNNMRRMPYYRDADEPWNINGIWPVPHQKPVINNEPGGASSPACHGTAFQLLPTTSTPPLREGLLSDNMLQTGPPFLRSNFDSRGVEAQSTVGQSAYDNQYPLRGMQIKGRQVGKVVVGKKRSKKHPRSVPLQAKFIPVTTERNSSADGSYSRNQETFVGQCDRTVGTRAYENHSNSINDDTNATDTGRRIGRIMYGPNNGF